MNKAEAQNMINKISAGEMHVVKPWGDTLEVNLPNFKTVTSVEEILKAICKVLET